MEITSSNATARPTTDGWHLRHLDLFSGIGGFALAARWTGRIETAAFCEIDPFCRQILRKHWPDTPIFHDIHHLTKDALAQSGVGTIDLVTGGFPCQPFSVAGKRRGQADDRHLWPQMRRIVAEVRPRWVLGENVANFANMGLDECLADLEAEGYEAWALVLPACAVGAPHRRERVWIVAHADDSDARGPEERQAHGPRLPEPAHGGHAVADADGPQRRQDAPGRHRADRQGAGREEEAGGPAAPGSAGRAGAVADADRVPPGEGQDRAAAGRAEPAGGGWWASEPGVGRVADGVSHRVDRLRALGNAIVPQVAYAILSAIAERGGIAARVASLQPALSRHREPTTL